MMLQHKFWRPTPFVPSINVPNLLQPTGRTDTAAPQYQYMPTTDKPPIASTVAGAQVDETFPIHQHGDFHLKLIWCRTNFGYLGDGCGQTKHFIFNGNDVSRGAWPWLTAIFVTTEKGLEFKCGGTLISENHVITGYFFKSK
jgi:Trypsin